ncbi:SWI/SNF-related matrix-associated actin-dependent regulator of chromatin subfamily A-like protein 1 isoform X2 [Brienomyrus brachyistius]|uniref:SWI/SNF-related matrix-associated actin-dependent regulator of chromatin subfamily A-like protein 1 isoform X2 n=1 Tax=Brienomyrus brachyistius TaxID=42636 RepID=UPI0020B1D45D|nr:SWI/SNF-related matrix-associated actin-dependent regulator of chromatin subfamily A-like protein 1 isoform X2 [Brienomyrus brachyistius]
MSASLTAEQKRQIEENRQRALARRAERHLLKIVQHCNQPLIPTTVQARNPDPPSQNVMRTQKASLRSPGKTHSGSGCKNVNVTDRPSQVGEGVLSRDANSQTTQSRAEPGSNDGAAEAGPVRTPGRNTGSLARGKCVLHDGYRFRVEIGYSPKLIELFKSIPSRNYDPETKIWNFGLEDYHRLMEDVRDMASVSLQALQKSEQPARQFTARSALLKVCQGWQKPDSAVQGHCCLLTRSRFEVNLAYHADAVAVFKQMPSKKYDMTTRKWNFLLEDFKVLMEMMVWIPRVQVGPLPQAVIQAFSSQFDRTRIEPMALPEVDLSGVDSTLRCSLMPFQRDGVSFAVSRQGRLLLADDMGLGKTVQAICIAALYRDEWPLMVVSPSSVCFTWAEAFKRWLPSLQWDRINVVLTGKNRLWSDLVNIISYDLLSKVKKPEVPTFNVLIMDESHYLKNMKTARCKAALPLLKAARRVILLSGTPALSRPAELYTQILAVRPSFFPRFHDFGLRYCDARQMPWGWDYSGSSNLGELKLLLEESVMIRRLKSEVLSQLPAKQRKVVTVTTDGISAHIKAALSTAAEELSKSQRGKRQEKEALLIYYSHTAEAKTQAVIEYMMDLLECGREKFLVFAHHKLMLDSITKELGKKNITYIRIDGATPSAERQALCHRFQFSEKKCVAVLSITAANMGITLHSASLVLFAELFWNPGVLIQAEDRVHRIGQTSSVDVHYLVAKGTADDYLWPMIQEKMNVLKKAGLSESSLSESAKLTSFQSKDPQKRTIVEMFQRSFSEDPDPDEVALLAAASAWEDCDPEKNSDKSENMGESPCKKPCIEH